MRRYEGKKVVIIGGTSGMGLATAKMLLDAGARVLVTGRSKGGLESAQKELGKDAIVVSSDARSLTDLDALAARAKAEFHTIDLLFVNAGFAERIGGFGGNPKSILSTTGFTRSNIFRLRIYVSLDPTARDQGNIPFQRTCPLQLHFCNGRLRRLVDMQTGQSQLNSAPRRKLTWRRYLMHIAGALFFTCGLWIQPAARKADAAKMEALAKNGVRVIGKIQDIRKSSENGEDDDHMKIVSYGYRAHPRGDMKAALMPYNHEEIATEDEIAEFNIGGPIEVVYPLTKPADGRPAFVLRHKIPSGQWGRWLLPLPLLIVLVEGLFLLRRRRPAFGHCAH